ncbi:MAG: ribosome recycling factor family protein [Psychromonas sp.]
MPNNASKKLSVKLNNFLHRIDCKETIIKIATQHGCSLTRIRRSRNWLLTGNQSQLVEISDQLRRTKALWIAQAINQALPKPTLDLALIMKSNPAMTVNRLISETGCTLIEARGAIDAAEGFI